MDEEPRSSPLPDHMPLLRTVVPMSFTQQKGDAEIELPMENQTLAKRVCRARWGGRRHWRCCGPRGGHTIPLKPSAETRRQLRRLQRWKNPGCKDDVNVGQNPSSTATGGRGEGAGGRRGGEEREGEGRGERGRGERRERERGERERERERGEEREGDGTLDFCCLAPDKPVGTPGSTLRASRAIPSITFFVGTVIIGSWVPLGFVRRALVGSLVGLYRPQPS